MNIAITDPGSLKRLFSGKTELNEINVQLLSKQPYNDDLLLLSVSDSWWKCDCLVDLGFDANPGNIFRIHKFISTNFGLKIEKFTILNNLDEVFGEPQQIGPEIAVAEIESPKEEAIINTSPTRRQKSLFWGKQPEGNSMVSFLSNSPLIEDDSNSSCLEATVTLDESNIIEKDDIKKNLFHNTPSKLSQSTVYTSPIKTSPIKKRNSVSTELKLEMDNLKATQDVLIAQIEKLEGEKKKIDFEMGMFGLYERLLTQLTLKSTENDKLSLFVWYYSYFIDRNLFKSLEIDHSTLLKEFEKRNSVLLNDMKLPASTFELTSPLKRTSQRPTRPVPRSRNLERSMIDLITFVRNYGFFGVFLIDLCETFFAVCETTILKDTVDYDSFVISVMDQCESMSSSEFNNIIKNILKLIKFVFCLCQIDLDHKKKILRFFSTFITM
ncbi:hypothetical protein PCE1_003177 [Barthelona sp. PCE]